LIAETSSQYLPKRESVGWASICLRAVGSWQLFLYKGNGKGSRRWGIPLKRIHVFGKKNTGKTTPIAELVQHYTNPGRRVGTTMYTPE
jgi:hypothetical protein